MGLGDIFFGDFNALFTDSSDALRSSERTLPSLSNGNVGGTGAPVGWAGALTVGVNEGSGLFSRGEILSLPGGDF